MNTTVKLTGFAGAVALGIAGAIAFQHFPEPAISRTPQQELMFDLANTMDVNALVRTVPAAHRDEIRDSCASIYSGGGMSIFEDCFETDLRAAVRLANSLPDSVWTGISLRACKEGLGEAWRWSELETCFYAKMAAVKRDTQTTDW